MSDSDLRTWLQRQLDRAAWAGAWEVYATIAGYLGGLDGYGTADLRRDLRETLACGRFRVGRAAGGDE